MMSPAARQMRHTGVIEHPRQMEIYKSRMPNRWYSSPCGGGQNSTRRRQTLQSPVGKRRFPTRTDQKFIKQLFFFSRQRCSRFLEPAKNQLCFSSFPVWCLKLILFVCRPLRSRLRGVPLGALTPAGSPRTWGLWPINLSTWAPLRAGRWL